MNNPLLRIANVPELSKMAHAAGAKLLVDNTFTPMIFSPYQLGADVVIYSMTKFVNGKNDCVAGAICGSAEYINSLIDVNSGWDPTGILCLRAVFPVIVTGIWILKSIRDGKKE
jgi:methionine-gamma-lyase